jgi:hypothetical protein
MLVIMEWNVAPDGKIYISSLNYLGWMSLSMATWLFYYYKFKFVRQLIILIVLGAACDFQLFNFNLGGYRAYWGLPNNPDYELGAWVGSPCDTLTTNLTPNPSPEARGAWMQAWYNHEWNMIHVNAAQLKGKKGSVAVV